MTEKELFEKALAIVLEFEGYKTEDTGGRTVFGISENAHPEEVEKMWNMPEDQALEIAKGIYSLEYWEKLFDERNRALTFFEGGPECAVCLFDTAVNLGVAKAIEIWQNGRRECNIDFKKLREFILWARVEHYVNLARKIKYKPYLRGWLNRVIQLRKKVREIENG
jgi:lysozyme family protein